MKIAIGLPAYNEEQNIGKIITQLKQYTDTIIVCNDGSNDSTALIAEKLGAAVINHPKNLGYGASIRSLFIKGKEIECDILVTFDADGQHNVKDIESVIQPILDQDADIVIGSRFLDKDSSIPKYRKMGIKVITKITNTSIGKDITDSQSGFRAYSKKILNAITPSDYGMGVSTEILIKASKMNFKVIEVPIIVSYEGNTSTHHPVSHGVLVIVSTLKFISIEHPLKFYGLPGIFFLTLGLFFILWTIQGFTDTRQVITNLALLGIGSTILGAMLMMTSIMLFSLVSVVREKRH
ncbi:glycosyl transferase [Nitrosopumilus sp. b3]|uniref:glycosyltransferase family 2 protein n=1 Tax=Nitrosopumilus sp. b3 TaxID=2109909 RepID=UPI0015F60238|nr:glycosyltransferase family 2 protein [Nitrosopumilus sp. b3]KAF6247006.1 glycosyl transferase [Nitrosopumilus sp. b3]